jgi:hypothetical protein
MLTLSVVFAIVANSTAYFSRVFIDGLIEVTAYSVVVTVALCSDNQVRKLN